MVTELAPEILSLIKNRNEPSLVSLAVWALGKMEYREAIPHLSPLLHHQNEEIRVWAAWALGEFGNADLEHPLEAALKRERSERVRSAIGGGLKKIRFEPTRVFRGQIRKALRPPEPDDLLVLEIVQKLQDLEWPKDEDKIILLRRQLLQEIHEMGRTCAVPKGRSRR